uniref:Uncharacterized protein n=1 Tax=Branchiostoma floridae TaxID=7739 RepID=C3Y9U0_BRAFL|eukprot:XP_002606839.1 hypothetical protein BRAFLDRAFT_130440 [Branchiostoma floridae]
MAVTGLISLVTSDLDPMKQALSRWFAKEIRQERPTIVFVTKLGNTNGPPAFRPHHLKTPLQRARDIVQRRLGNPATQAEISTSPTASPPRRWKSSYSNMYEPTKQRSGDLRTQSEQSPRAHSKHALGQHDVCDPGQRVNSRPSRDGVHQKAGNPPPLRDRHELASRDPWNYVMQYMGRVPAVKTSSNVLRH